ncbi:MAG: ATPase domain-containing protein [Candidatus Bathyarchaeia archaeon]
MQRPVKLTLLIVSMLLAVLAFTRASPQEMDGDNTLNIVLYAYLDEHLTVLEGRILGVSPIWGGLMQTNATREIIFTLYPPLGGDLKIKGTVLFKSWLRSDGASFGKLVMTLYEKDKGGERSQVASVEGYVAVNPRRYEYTFGVAGLEHIFKSGSTIQFGLIFYPSGGKPANIYLEWNNPEVATRVILPCAGHIAGTLSLWDVEGNRKFGDPISLNESKMPLEASLRMNISDVFGMQDIKSISLSLKDILGRKILENESLTLLSYGSQLYSAVYAKNLTITGGVNIVEISVLDSAGNLHKLTKEFRTAYYYLLKIKVKNGEGRAIPNATYTISNKVIDLTVSGVTGGDGLITHPLAGSGSVGSYKLNITYKGFPITLDLRVDSPLYKEVEFPLYTLKVKVTSYGIPLYHAKVSLWSGPDQISSGRTDTSGRIGFGEIPLDNYTLLIDYMLQKYEVDLNFREYDREYEIKFSPPLFRIGPWILVFGVAAALSLNLILMFRGREKVKVSDFKYLEKLFTGHIPEALSIMILGPPGSGKTVTLESFVKLFLQEGRKCIYVTNTGFPEEVRRSLEGFDVPVEEYENKDRLTFIDCYSSIAGGASKERHFIESPGDLTRLGIEITACLEHPPKGVDLFFDSLSQLLTYVKQDQLVTFINAIGARMKGNNGRFVYTVRSNIDAGILGVLEEASDCVIELSIRDLDGVQERNLRIKKLRGRRFSSRWVKFEVHPGKGVVFIIRYKSF